MSLPSLNHPILFLALAGLRWFIVHPRLWWRPYAAYVVAGVLCVGSAVAVGWWAWPTHVEAWYLHWLVSVPLALSAAAGTGMLVFVLVMPVVLALVLDTVARRVLTERGVEVREESVVRAITSTLRVVLGTLGMRLGWTLVACIAGFCGPLGVPIVAYAMARVAITDAWDTVLAQQGLSGGERLVLLRNHKRDLRLAAITAGGLHLLLSATIIAWPLWMPSLVAGTALRLPPARS